MILPRFYFLLRTRITPLLVALVIFGCQSAPETASAPEPSAATPAEATSPPEAAPETAAASPETPTAATPEATPATSPDPGTVSESQCSAAAFVVDSDPAGLNVRSGPGSDSDVIDTLPTDGPVEVTIAGAVDNWLKLTVAWSMEQQELEEPGWVYGPLLGVTTRSDAENPEAAVPLLAAPDATAAVTAEVPQSSQVSLIGCSGEWLQVQAGETVGWLAAENQCSSPVGFCP